MKGVNLHRLTPNSDFDYEFAEMQKAGIKYVRFMPNFFISVTLEIDVLAIQRLYTTAEKYDVKLLVVMHNKLPWPHHTKLDFNTILSLWMQLLAIDHNSVIAYEPINEPYHRDNDENVKVVTKLLRRFTNKLLVVYIGFDFDKAEPLPDNNLVYTMHDYGHYKFTHQGIGDDKPILDEPYPGNYAGYSSFLHREITWDAEAKVKHYQPIRDFQIKYNVPILLGEFSCTVDANGSDDWVKDSMDIFNEYGWSWFYHEWIPKDMQNSFTKWMADENRIKILTEGWT